MARVVFIADPLVSTDFVQYRAVFPILEKLRSRFEVTLASPMIGPGVQRELERQGIRPISGGARFPMPRHSRDEVPAYIISWLRDSLASLNQRALTRALRRESGFRVNYSMTTAIPSDCWYVQGHPLEAALHAMRPSVNRPLSTILELTTPAIAMVDWHHIKQFVKQSHRIYAPNGYVAQWYADHGIAVSGTIPGAVGDSFCPSTSSPTRDYIFAYLGHETDTTALERLMDSGLPVRIFGSKSVDWVNRLLQGRQRLNVQFMGRVTPEELRSAYTNALFTAFPFTEEPFGLVPLESMACGTPVLTYRRQGPGEAVLHQRTGWLVDSADEFVRVAQHIFHEGYSKEVREQCRARAAGYSVEHVADRWRSAIEARLSGNPEPSSIAWSRAPSPASPHHETPSAKSPRPIGVSFWPSARPGDALKPPVAPSVDRSVSGLGGISETTLANRPTHSMIDRLSNQVTVVKGPVPSGGSLPVRPRLPKNVLSEDPRSGGRDGG